MKRKDFYFDLPQELIAQYPMANRSDSRLLSYNRATREYGHYQFRDLADFLQPGDLLIMNDTKVIPARLYGKKASGGKVEMLLERILGERSFLAHIKGSKSLKPGAVIYLDKGFIITLSQRQDDVFLCHTDVNIYDLLDQTGHIPLPPYIDRADETLDRERYQTVYAKFAGSVAAPTAGLHFDEAVLASLKARGVQWGYLTLHVGAGTFQPVRCDNITEHRMHREYYSVDEKVCCLVNAAKVNGQRVIAVGTTALRSLESATVDGLLQPGCKDTDIFIYPGYKFKLCDGLITNFHLPESTLLMLVSAFIGHQEAMALYAEAIKKGYRFFSYGDSSLLL